MDIHTKEWLFAAAVVLLAAGPFIWAGCDHLIRTRRQRAKEAAEFRALMRRESMLRDAIDLELDRGALLRARVESPERLPDRMAVAGEVDRVLDGLYPRVRDLYVPPTRTR